MFGITSWTNFQCSSTIGFYSPFKMTWWIEQNSDYCFPNSHRTRCKNKPSTTSPPSTAMQQSTQANQQSFSTSFNLQNLFSTKAAFGQQNGQQSSGNQFTGQGYNQQTTGQQNGQQSSSNQFTGQNYNQQNTGQQNGGYSQFGQQQSGQRKGFLISDI